LEDGVGVALLLSQDKDLLSPPPPSQTSPRGPD